jgi:hypothetical protein
MVSLPLRILNAFHNQPKSMGNCSGNATSCPEGSMANSIAGGDPL